METESSEWQLQGQPTVLLTLAHIFHRFAPLLVRRWWGRAEGDGHARCVCGRCMHPLGPQVLRCMRPRVLTCQGSLKPQPSDLKEASWGGKVVMSQAKETKP